MTETIAPTVGEILERNRAEADAPVSGKNTMNAPAKIEVSGLEKLREPFPEHQISKLPKESRKQSDERKNRIQGCMVWECKVCGGAHHKDAVHLDYVGHAAATDRLLDADIRWTWEPVADPASLGLPVAPGGMWIKLTVDGVSRYGFGSADGKTGGDAIKEIIGDAIRNAGMRFGMALDLWHKGDLHLDEEAAAEPDAKGISAAQCADLRRLIKEADSSEEAFVEYLKCNTLPELPAARFEAAKKALNGRIARTKADKAEKNNPQTSDVLEDEIPY